MDYKQLDTVVMSKCARVNLLVGNINNIKEIVDRLHQADKKVYLHIDMIDGLGKDKDAVRYIAEQLKIEGIISTKGALITAARGCGIHSVQRVFAIDTAALKNAVKTLKVNNPDEVEIMPGLMPSIIKAVKPLIKRPLIVGGLIKSQRDAEIAFGSGADYVSSGCEKLWGL